MAKLTRVTACLLAAAVGGMFPPAYASPPNAVDLPVALQTSSSSWRLWLRKRMVHKADWAKYGLRLDDNWQAADVGQPVVVLLHGFNSAPDRADGLIAQAREQGLPCGVFAYPNDQPLNDSAAFLSRELNCFATQHPGRRVALVTHSMGGLVARACVEDVKLNPKVVDRLIMVSPPTHGSMLARWAVGLDMWEHWLNRRSGDPWQRLRDSFVDGLSEAPTDLRPNSKFLRRLNSRPRNPAIQYTLLLGNRAQLSDSQRYILQQSLLTAADHAPGWEASVEEVDRWIGALDEVIDGRGDGAVALCRGRLDGVDDTHVLSFSHLSVVKCHEEEATQQVGELILNRLLTSNAP